MKIDRSARVHFEASQIASSESVSKELKVLHSAFEHWEKIGMLTTPLKHQIAKAIRDVNTTSGNLPQQFQSTLARLEVDIHRFIETPSKEGSENCKKNIDSLINFHIRQLEG